MMLLLDTHILLWAAYAPEKLSKRAQTILEAPEHSVAFSVASIWEIAIKVSLNTSGFSVAPGVLRRGLIESGYVEVAITSAHAVAVTDLPRLHGDPFDRMLVAQANIEGFTLITADRRVADYGASVYLV
jgi:PIN domain nuclease of toxin-antitoxin system